MTRVGPADMRKVKKLPRAAFSGEKFPQKCVIHDCFQFMTKGHTRLWQFKILKPNYNPFRLMCDLKLNGLIHA